jgi:hypothetical protein
MSSLINPSSIDGTYPIAGQDNDSQGFRDNFTNIKNNFTIAQTEISALQTAVTNLSAAGIQYVVPTEGAAIQITAGTTVVVLNPSTGINTATVAMPVSPVNGATVEIGFGGNINALSMVGGTIHSPLTNGVDGVFGKWVYSGAGAAWFRIG